MSEWVRKTIAECAADEPYSTQIGPFGKALTPEEYTSSGVPLLRGINVNSGRFYDDGFVFISEETANRLKKFESYPDDILLVHKGTLGQIGIMPKNRKYHRYIMGNSMLRVKCNKEKLLPEYLYYWLCSKEGQHYLFSRVSQVGVPQIQKPLTTLREATLPVPEIEEQQHIVNLLSCLDAKIENLRQQNNTLEQIAQTLFKHWFIDFEFPNTDGKPYKSSGGEMQSSVLGDIPKDWRVGKIEKLFNFLEGPGIRNWQYTETGTRFINIRLIQNGNIEVKKANFISDEEAKGKYSHFHLQEKDLVISTSGTLGKCAIVRKQHLPLLLNTSVIRFRPKNEQDYQFMYQVFQSKYFLQKLNSLASGSVQLNFGPIHLRQIEIFIPPREILNSFSELTKAVYKQYLLNYQQIETLKNIRDALLPKLMSGQIRIEE